MARREGIDFLGYAKGKIFRYLLDILIFGLLWRVKRVIGSLESLHARSGKADTFDSPCRPVLFGFHWSISYLVLLLSHISPIKRRHFFNFILDLSFHM